MDIIVSIATTFLIVRWERWFLVNHGEDGRRVCLAHPPLGR